MTTVYVGSAWRQGWEPFATIIATDSELAQLLLDIAVHGEEQLILDTFECPYHAERRCDCEPLTSIVTGGIFAENLDNVGLSERELEYLEQDGYVYIHRTGARGHG